MAESPPGRLKLKAQLMVGPGIALGPGKVELLEWIARTGSISAAARGMRLSYRRAWMMVDTMNHAFKQPLVERSQGGAHGGGAVLTDEGATVVERYRAMEADLEAAAQVHAAGLLDRLA
jgi:molybdate transport system regulatory protein